MTGKGAPFERQISDGLGPDGAPGIKVSVDRNGQFEAFYDVSGLAAETIAAATREVAALAGAGSVRVDQVLASRWFGKTLRPMAWQVPNPWDAVAGDYRTRDGWIKLHTNAPHHRAAALGVLGCDGERQEVAAAVAGWTGAELESAVLIAGGCAAEMRNAGEWAAHPQGKAVAREPLIQWDTAPSIAPDAGDHGGNGLVGVRILDLTRILAGPIATRFLATFGAEVLRIDPPDWEEPAQEPEVTVGKRCARLDLRTMDGRQTFERLLTGADVLVHGYRPGALDALGYDPEVRRRLAPGLIDVSLSAYGWTGPWAGRRGFDSLVQMSTGIAAEGMAHTGNKRPHPLPVQALDHATGYLMAAAVCRALRRRRADGGILSARLSLARTAYLLVSGGTGYRAPTLAAESNADLAPGIEETDWGLARRLAFPAQIRGLMPRWRIPAGRLGRHPAAWI